MKTFKAKKGPLKTQLYFTSSEIERMCENELRSAGLLPDNPEAIRIDRFVEKRFCLTIQYDNLPQGLLGFTRFGSKGVENIVVTQALDEEGTVSAGRRVRSTLAHEAGHGLLHASLFALEKKSKKIFGESHDETPRVLCRDSNAALTGGGKVYSGEWWEHQANLVMRELLLPRVLIEKAVRPYLSSPGLLGPAVFDESKRGEAANALADIFDVNPIMVQYRLSELFPLTQI